MRLLICSPKPASESAQFLEQALKREGHSTIWADQAESETAGADAAYYRGRFDSQGNTEAMMAFSRAEAEGTKTINSSAGILNARHKLLTWRLLERARLPFPATFMPGSPPQQAPENGYMVKPDCGSCGQGIQFKPSWEKAVEAANCQGDSYLIQAFQPGQIVRVVSGKAGGLFGYYHRQIITRSEDGQETVILETGERDPLDKSDQSACFELAGMAVKALGCDMAGVDLVVNEGKAFILEANTGWAMRAEDEAWNRLIIEEMKRIAES